MKIINGLRVEMKYDEESDMFITYCNYKEIARDKNTQRAWEKTERKIKGKK